MLSMNTSQKSQLNVFTVCTEDLRVIVRHFHFKLYRALHFTLYRALIVRAICVNKISAKVLLRAPRMRIGNEYLRRGPIL